MSWITSLADAAGLGRDALGGKAAGLAEMAAEGVPVPPGFVIPTAACDAYHAAGGRLPDGLEAELGEAIASLEDVTGREFGGRRLPLLVSVRSGAPQSMPGMLDTVLNLGFNDGVRRALEEETSSRRFALDTERRFLEIFGTIVAGVPKSLLRDQERAARRDASLGRYDRLTTAALEKVVAQHRAAIANRTGPEVLEDPGRQLVEAVRAVLDSWSSDRAVGYRKRRGIPDQPGTAVVVQTMVYGNRGSRSATGVLFTRNPATGAPELFGEYLTDAQGEDVVSGVRTPRPIADMRDEMPELHERLSKTATSLEAQFRDMQDVEFTIEEGELYVLQTRTAKRTAQAAIRVAVDLADQGLISRDEAVRRVSPEQLEQLQVAQIDPEAKRTAMTAGRLLLRGLPASPGPSTGGLAFNLDEVRKLASAGQPAILVREETSPDDVPAMEVAAGVITAQGGATSHAAVVARELGVPCVVGCDGLRIDEEAGVALLGAKPLGTGDLITMDGASGEVFEGELPTSLPTRDADSPAEKLRRWAEEREDDCGAPTSDVERPTPASGGE